MEKKIFTQKGIPSSFMVFKQSLANLAMPVAVVGIKSTECEVKVLQQVFKNNLDTTCELTVIFP